MVNVSTETQLRDAIFAANAGETSLLEQTADGRYYVYRVDKVEPAHERPLSEVRDQVEQAWRTEQQKAKAKARAEELRAAASGPASLDELAKANADTRPVEVTPLLRTDDGAQQGLSAAAVAAMFATPAGEVAAQVVEVPDGAAILAVEEVIPATIDDQMLNATRDAVANSMRAELLGAYETALREGGVVIGVCTHSNEDLNDIRKRFQELNGENILTH